MVEQYLVGQHLILYDGTCGFCHWTVRWVINRDKKERFLFAPLQGDTARRFSDRIPLAGLNLESVVLIENWQEANPAISVEGKAAARIATLLGGWWRFWGFFYRIMPSLYDKLYRYIAKRRNLLFPKASCIIPEGLPTIRFLP